MRCERRRAAQLWSSAGQRGIGQCGACHQTNESGACQCPASCRGARFKIARKRKTSRRDRIRKHVLPDGSTTDRRTQTPVRRAAPAPAAPRWCSGLEGKYSALERLGQRASLDRRYRELIPLTPHPSTRFSMGTERRSRPLDAVFRDVPGPQVLTRILEVGSTGWSDTSCADVALVQQAKGRGRKFPILPGYAPAVHEGHVCAESGRKTEPVAHTRGIMCSGAVSLTLGTCSVPHGVAFSKQQIIPRGTVT